MKYYTFLLWTFLLFRRLGFKKVYGQFYSCRQQFAFTNTRTQRQINWQKPVTKARKKKKMKQAV